MVFKAHDGTDWTKLALIIFSAASGFAVGNLYLAQPMLADIAQSLGTTTDACGFLMTATQIGYALGILLIVPLGDKLNRKTMTSACMIVSAVALALCSIAPSLILLTAAISAVGLTTVAGQIIIPLVRDKSSEAHRGSSVGIVSAGVTLGILVARAVSGLIAETLGWRSVYLIFCVINIAFSILLFLAVPSGGKRSGGKAFPALEIVSLLRGSKQVLPLMAIAGLEFGVCFNIFWNGATFLLSAAPYGMNVLQIGLVSLAGVVGAAASLGIGKLLDKGYGRAALVASVMVVAASLVLAALEQTSIVAIVIAAALLSLGVQGVSVLAQTRVISAVPGRSSLLNTGFVFNNFVMAAVGSTLTSLLWAFGWIALMAAALACTLLALVISLKVHPANSQRNANKQR